MHPFAPTDTTWASSPWASIDCSTPTTIRAASRSMRS